MLFGCQIIVSGKANKLNSGLLLSSGLIKLISLQTKSTVGASLRDVRKGNRVGLALDRSRNLHLYIDDKHIGVVAPGVADPCYVMIDLLACLKKVCVAFISGDSAHKELIWFSFTRLVSNSVSVNQWMGTNDTDSDQFTVKPQSAHTDVSLGYNSLSSFTQ